MPDEMVPFLMVEDIGQSVAFYVDGLGFEMEESWRPGGNLRWCQLRKSGAALMLQEHSHDYTPQAKGRGTRLCIMCDDALAYHREFSGRGIETDGPYVGNGLWVTPVTDPDGYHLDFESPTDIPEETRLSDLPHRDCP